MLDFFSCQIFSLITALLDSNLQTRQLETLMVSICQALANTLPDCPRLCGRFVESPSWMQLVDICLKRSDDDIHCSLQSVLYQLSLRGVGADQIKWVAYCRFSCCCRPGKRGVSSLLSSLTFCLWQVDSVSTAFSLSKRLFSKNLSSGSVVSRQASARCLGGFAFSSDTLQSFFRPTFELLVAVTKAKVRSCLFESRWSV